MDGSRYLKILLEPVFDCSLKMFKKVSAMIFGDGKQLQYTHTQMSKHGLNVCVCVWPKSDWRDKPQVVISRNVHKGWHQLLD